MRPTQSVVYYQPTLPNTLLFARFRLRLEYTLPACLTPHNRRPSVRRRGEILAEGKFVSQVNGAGGLGRRIFRFPLVLDFREVLYFP